MSLNEQCTNLAEIPCNSDQSNDPLHRVNSNSAVFAAVLSDIYKSNVEILFQLDSGVSHKLVCFRIRAESGILSALSDSEYPLSFSSHQSISRARFLNLTTDDQISILITTFDDLVKGINRQYNLAESAITDYMKTSNNRLGNIKIRLRRHGTDSFYVRASWSGIGHDLEYGEQFESIDSYAPQRKMYSIVIHILERINKRDELREAMRKRGFRPDRPLAAILRSSGKTCEDLFHAAKNHGFTGSRMWETSPPKPMDFAGYALSIDFRDGYILSTFNLTEHITWKRGMLQIVNLDLPETFIIQCKGRRLCDIVNHPCLEGLEITNANKFIKKGQKTVIYLNTKEI